MGSFFSSLFDHHVVIVLKVAAMIAL